MQATVHNYDPDTRTGTVVTDDGVLVPLTRQAFEDSALRTLRQGQRLTVVIDGRGGDARVTGIAIESVGMVPTRPSRPLQLARTAVRRPVRPARRHRVQAPGPPTVTRAPA